MPKKQYLDSIIPNRFYEIDAVLKYQHVGANVITGIIEQNKVQSKICIPKDGIELQEGKQYVFGKCFNSKNGWLYAKKPSETVIEKDVSQMKSQLMTLQVIFNQRDHLSNCYVSCQLRVISVQLKQTFQKNCESLIFYKLKCFANGLIIDVEIWNKEINTIDLINRIFNFFGLKIKITNHQTIILVSSVYTKILELDSPVTDVQKFNFRPNQIYRNVSSLYQIRNIEQVLKASQLLHKNYSLCVATTSFLEQFSYEGCDKCKKKLELIGCLKCGSNAIKTQYHYQKLTLEDSTGMVECAVFDQRCQEVLQRQNGVKKFIFKVKSSAKRNIQTGQPFVSHVIIEIKDNVNFQ